MKPIEEGCLAIVVSPPDHPHLGETVTCLKRLANMVWVKSKCGGFLSRMATDDGCDFWETDKEITVTKGKNEYSFCFDAESSLMRIDGYEEENQNTMNEINLNHLFSDSIERLEKLTIRSGGEND